MKRLFCLYLFSLLCAAPAVRAEDAAAAAAARQESEENYKILKGNISDLTEANTALRKRIDSLEREISELRAQVAKPAGIFATPEDLKHLADAIEEIDKKREADKKLILKEISDLGRSLSHSGSHVRETPPEEEKILAPANPDQPTFTYVVKEGDYLSTIAKAYREKGIKVTVDQILAANPGLKANALVPRMKILIPDTRVAGATKPDSK